MNNSFIWHKELIQKFIENENPDMLNKQDIQGETGFTFASAVYPDMAIKILNMDAFNPNIANRQKETGFIKACECQPEAAMKMLEKDNIKFNTQDNKKETGFHKSCKIDDPNLASEMLRKNNIDFNIQNRHGVTGLMMICIWHTDLILSALENKNIDINIKNLAGETAWDFADEYNLDGLKIYNSYLENQKLKQQAKKLTNKSSSKKNIL